MSRSEVHQCECPHCQQEMSYPDQELHRQMNLLLSRLDEQQRRWYVAVESNRIGAGEIGCSPKSRAWTKRRSSGDGKNWLGSFRSGQCSECVCPAEAGPAPKKRSSARGSAGRFGAARNGRGSHE